LLITLCFQAVDKRSMVLGEVGVDSLQYSLQDAYTQTYPDLLCSNMQSSTFP
jgi:hypothetical protein